jgi:hypothetical protein
MNQTETGSYLSEVLNRIEALQQQNEIKETRQQPCVPRLTEVFEGAEPLNFIAADTENLPELDALGADALPLSDVPVALAEAQVEGAPDTPSISAAQREALLKALKPVIRAAVKKAVLNELVVIEKVLKTTLEQDMLEALKKRIDSGQY